MKTYRTGRPEVRVAVTASASRLEVTVTNRTRDALLPEGGNWREALRLDFERQGWAAGVLRFGPQPFEPTLGPGRSHTFAVDLIHPQPPPARWRLSLRYEVEGLEGQRFVTAPVLFESPPEAEPESK